MNSDEMEEWMLRVFSLMWWFSFFDHAFCRQAVCVGRDEISVEQVANRRLNHVVRPRSCKRVVQVCDCNLAGTLTSCLFAKHV